MSLLICPECGHKVSSEAEKCPECGYPIHQQRVGASSPSETASTSSSSSGSISRDDNNGLLILGIVLIFVCWPIGLILIIVSLSQRKKAKKKKEKSDMEKILIKNAKIDALASIDPTKPEDAKKKIDIVNKLDDLD